jgi:hypothetical protein
LRAWGGQRRCGVKDNVGLIVSQTLGQRGDDATGSGMAPGAQRHELGEDDVVAGSGTASWAWGRRLRGRWHHRLRSGKMETRKGARPWSGTMVQRLWGGLDDGAAALGKTRRWHEIHGGRRRRGLHGNFRREILAA